MGGRLTPNYLQLFCEKNSDGTRKLRLKGNELQQRIKARVSEYDIPQVSKFVEDNPKITHLNLCHNEIGDEGLLLLCRNLRDPENNLKILNLIGCQISFRGMRYLHSVCLTGSVKLKVLRLAGNKIGPNGGHLFALMLPHCPTLEYADIGDTDQTPDSIDNIVLQLPFTNLQILNISRLIPQSPKYQYDPKIVAESLAEMLRLSKTLQELHAQKIGFDGHDIQTLRTGLERNESLKFLDVGYNNFGDFGAEVLAEFLKSRPSLIALNLSGSQVKESGAVALGLMMPFSKLRLLDISYNRINNKGMVFLLDSIKKPYMLRYFYCFGNELGHEPCKRIKRMLRSTVFEQNNIDVEIYCVDEILSAARHAVDHYKHRYYEVMDHGCAVELTIKRNRIELPEDEPRALINFAHVERYPALGDPKAEKREKRVKDCPEEIEDEEKKNKLKEQFSRFRNCN